MLLFMPVLGQHKTNLFVTAVFFHFYFFFPKTPFFYCVFLAIIDLFGLPYQVCEESSSSGGGGAHPSGESEDGVGRRGQE